MKKLIFTIIIILGFFNVQKMYAQTEDSLMNVHLKYIQSPFVSDGQQYRAEVTANESVEFRLTFYGGNTYRITGFSDIGDHEISYILFDKQRNVLFSSIEQQNPKYWDFKFNYTTECIIEAKQLTLQNKNGNIIMLIGFMRHE